MGSSIGVQKKEGRGGQTKDHFSKRGKLKESVDIGFFVTPPRFLYLFHDLVSTTREQYCVWEKRKVCR